MGSDWQVFQSDVLDVFRQYEKYFDHFELVGSLSDDSRPDSFARITREDKKEIWVLDAKRKAEIGGEDMERMEKYVEMIESNPIDVGLELSELADHKVRGIFVTETGDLSPNGFEQVRFSALHAFLQKELVYTDTDKVVRDVAKMMERKQLSHNQARLLFRSIKPLEQHMSKAIQCFESLETDYIGLELEKPPINSYDYNIPVDAMLRHEPRDKVFLIDIPYSQKAVENLDDKVEEIRERLEDVEKEVFYAAINSFDAKDQKYLYQLDDLEEEIRTTAGIVAPEQVAELFIPKIPVQKQVEDGHIVVRDTEGIGFQLKVQSEDDISHRVEIDLPEGVAAELNNSLMKTGKELGNLKNTRFQLKFEVTTDLQVKTGGGTESLEAFKNRVKDIYQSSVNPVLAKKNNSK
jgi:uncharacterized protein YfkK (UPF0435 family)